MKNLYVIKIYGGDYDDAFVSNVCVCSTLEKAESVLRHLESLNLKSSLPELKTTLVAFNTRLGNLGIFEYPIDFAFKVETIALVD